jgi:DNA-binding MarR family transcriptional regulator
MQEEYSQQDICNAWSLSKQTVNSIVSNMVKKGYVYLEMVPGSKNRKIICLTEEGRKFGEKVIYPLVFAEQKISWCGVAGTGKWLFIVSLLSMCRR